MNEGDIIYYESARCLHGRMQVVVFVENDTIIILLINNNNNNKPLEGEFYVNLFAHYRPVGDPEWFLKENPEETPIPVSDLGECQSNGSVVSCTGDIHAPFLSPKLDTLRGPNDLFDFWWKHNPNNKNNNVQEEL